MGFVLFMFAVLGIFAIQAKMVSERTAEPGSP